MQRNREGFVAWLLVTLGNVRDWRHKMYSIVRYGDAVLRTILCANAIEELSSR